MADPSTPGPVETTHPEPPGPLDRVSLTRATAVAGPPEAPAIVLLHGTRRTRAMWRHQLDGLADRFRVLAPDLPAHGTLADIPFRLGDAADAVATIIADLPARRAVVVGQSLGGYVGMDLAARHPDLLAGLVLANATAEPRYIASHAPRTVGAYLLEAAGSRLRLRLAGADGRHGGGRDGDGRDGDGAAHRHDHDVDATHGWLFKGGTRALVTALRETFIPRLAAYPGPTLIVNGESDALFRSGEAAFLRVAADGRVEIIPGAGHEVNEDQPARFNAALARFAMEAHARRNGG